MSCERNIFSGKILSFECCFIGLFDYGNQKRGEIDYCLSVIKEKELFPISRRCIPMKIRIT